MRSKPFIIVSQNWFVLYEKTSFVWLCLYCKANTIPEQANGCMLMECRTKRSNQFRKLVLVNNVHKRVWFLFKKKAKHFWLKFFEEVWFCSLFRHPWNKEYFPLKTKCLKLRSSVLWRCEISEKFCHLKCWQLL